MGNRLFELGLQVLELEKSGRWNRAAFWRLFDERARLSEMADGLLREARELGISEHELFTEWDRVKSET